VGAEELKEDLCQNEIGSIQSRRVIRLDNLNDHRLGGRATPKEGWGLRQSGVRSLFLSGRGKEAKEWLQN
jgi:hypothetical protein